MKLKYLIEFFCIPKKSFLYALYFILTTYKHTNMFNLDVITNKNNKDDEKKWSYRMLKIGLSASGKN